MPALVERLEYVTDCYPQARRLILEYFQSTGLQVQWKSDESPVTAADRGAERLLREAIRREFPQDAVLGEEEGETPGTSGYRWILDPVDGTRSFIQGVPLFGTLIGLEHDGEPVLGLCGMPALDEVVYAARGHGAWWRCGTQAPVAARVTNTASLADAMVSYTSVDLFEQTKQRWLFDRLRSAAKATRGWGDCYGHLLVATGRADLHVDPILFPWDASPFVTILTEAGGEFVDFQGRPTAHGGNGFSVNGHLKEQVLQILRAPPHDA